ncbi:hypothetical protein A1Q2_00346 [Trichosporon asahii var. asahii CBS 8904]|uniref:Uncharacterized protein n=1 Tax=Trichosporon asahii var. asahii (strain CBS 8904) TaxID=1220162 RepID=K1VXS5_TRIAC|nr:hypothetical protein A1Q2_00346 [Trichosporon asahii var. asahii CBS 8904]
MSDWDSTDFGAWDGLLEDLEEAEEVIGDGFLSEDTDSGLGIGRLINQARRQQQRKRLYKRPQLNGNVPSPYVRQPDIAIHPPKGSKIAQFPLEATKGYPSLDAAFYHLNSIALTLGFAFTRGGGKDRDNRYHHKSFHCYYGPTPGRGRNAQAYKNEVRCTYAISVGHHEEDGWYRVLYERRKHHQDTEEPKGTPSMLRTCLDLNDEWIADLVELGRPPREIGARLPQSQVLHNKQALYRRCTKHAKRLKHVCHNHAVTTPSA